jgi:hypothetical protein
MGRSPYQVRSTRLRCWMLVLGASAAIAGCGGDTAAGGPSAPGGGGSASCSPGSEGCVCYGNSTCDVPLTCASHLCVNLGTGGSAQGGISAGGRAAGAFGWAEGLPAAVRKEAR